MKVLYFDVERGHQTLGSKKDIQNMFSYPVLSPSTWVEFQSMIAKIYQVTKKTEDLDVGGIKFKETVEEVTTRNNVQVDAVIIDTFSELSKKYQRSLVNKTTGVMKLQEWGKLKNKLDTCLEFISRIPGVVICNCHSKVQTMDDGGNKIIPYIDGSTKEDISKWFDFVFYTVTATKGKNREYKWITKRTEKYDHAKDRTNLLPDTMEQDYNQVINAAKDKGFENCRILVVGSPGSGKTWSLKTLTERTDGGELEDRDGEAAQPEEEYDRAGEAELHANDPTHERPNVVTEEYLDSTTTNGVVNS